MKTAVIYYSKHHGNTKTILDFLCKDNELHLIDATKAKTESLAEYDLIGFASGIYYSKFHKSVLKFAEANLPEEKSVFFVYLRSEGRRVYKSNPRSGFAKISSCFGRVWLLWI